MKQYLSIATLMLLLSIAGSGWGATTGKITGVITDSQNSNPVVGASVSVDGTNLGGVTDVDGKYNIHNVPVGTYTLKISSVGYATIEVENVSVSADLATYQDHAMTSAATELGKIIRIVAEDPLIIRDKVAAISIIKRDELQALPTRGFEDVVGLQSGVVQIRPNLSIKGLRGAREATNSGSELNIRGGRASEVAYYVDGFSQQDPLSGNSTANISNNAIKEVTIIQGGFPVEYGHVQSGIVNVITMSGGDEYHADAEVVTDTKYGQSWYSLNFSGPLTEKGAFFFSGEFKDHDDRAPSSVTSSVLPDSPDKLPNNGSETFSYQGKLNYDFTPNMKFQLSANGSKDEWNQYLHSYLFNGEHAPFYEDKNLGINVRLTHTLSQKTFYNLSVSSFTVERFRGDGLYKEDIYAYGRPNGNPRNDAENLFRAWDDPTTPVVTDTATVNGVLRTFVTGGDESHVFDDYFKRKSSYIGFNGNITSELSREHTIKAGFEFQKHSLRFYRHYFPVLTYDPSIGFQDVNRYGYDLFGNESDTEGFENATKEPINIAAYLQDRFEYESLIITAGLRFDYFDYKAQRFRNENLPLDPDSLGFDGDASNDGEISTLESSDLEDSEKFKRISPRLGVAFPISDKTQMRFSYGKFFQRPELQNLYVGYDYMAYKVRIGGYYVSFGSPNLEPPKTTAYEIGLTHMLGENTVFDFNLFYRDVTGLVQVQNQPSAPTSFATYRNTDYGTIKGLEFGLKMRRVSNVALNIKYTYSFATGTGSFSNTGGNVAWVNGNAPKQTAPLAYDQRHKVTGIFDLRYASGEGPKLGDTYILENFGINFVFNAGSGLPYSPISIINEATLGAFAPNLTDVRNSARLPWTMTVDLKAEKKFEMSNFSFGPYLWVKNLFDRDNVTNVWEGSGRANTTGWLRTGEGQDFVTLFSTPSDDANLTGEEKYQLAQNDPRNYGAPRQVYFGLRVSF